LAGPRRWAWALGASALTHPLVWAWVSLGPSPWSYVGLVLAGEAFAVAAEGTLGRSLGAPRPWLGALLANGASVGVGMLIRAWTGWP
jgi:hypothetical protein